MSYSSEMPLENTDINLQAEEGIFIGVYINSGIILIY